MLKSNSKDVIHYPQLDTILSMEEFIKEHSGEFRKTALWKALPKNMMYQTFNLIYEYLSESLKIARDSERKIHWIWDPDLIKKYLEDETLFVR